MRGLGFTRVFTGLEIGSAAVRAAQVVRERGRWRLLSTAVVPLREGTLRCAYRSNNVLDVPKVSDALTEALAGLAKKTQVVGLSLPNEIIRVSIERYGELPRAREEAERMIAMFTEKALHLPGGSTRVTFHPLGGGEKEGSGPLLVTAGIREVIREYEKIVRDVGVEPRVVRPAGINQFNLYCGMLPDKGVVAYVGLFENFFTFYVLEEGRLVFYQEVKKAMLNETLYEDIEMTLQYFMSGNSKREIGKLYVGIHGEYAADMVESFRQISNMEMALLSESQVFARDDNRPGPGQAGTFAAAIGAAQSLAR